MGERTAIGAALNSWTTEKKKIRSENGSNGPNSDGMSHLFLKRTRERGKEALLVPQP